MSMIDKSHGSPYDRGRADSWYGRGIRPHYRVFDGHKMIKEVERSDMTMKELAEYLEGYNENEEDPSARKDWT